MKQLGGQAEALAAAYLQKQGLHLVTSNYHCRFGEIDLIMRDANTLVFVEVRLRSNDNFGGAAMSITATKRQRLVQTAQQYLQQNGDCTCRFDAILMRTVDMQSIEWIKNAFEA
ncbi:MAG TPA: YraN family protein [Methylophilaceae bacterium]|nr:YraN family protein [Methylophilaceae bacterium]